MCIDFMRVNELRESVKIVKEEEESEYMCFRAKRSAYSSVVRTLDSGGREYLKVRVGKITAKPAPEVDLEPSVYT